MTINDVALFAKSEKENGLTKFEPSTEINENGEFIVTKIKATYCVDTEEEADALINDARIDNCFAGCDKKFKQGKMNKAGEVTRPDVWTVVIKMKY